MNNDNTSSAEKVILNVDENEIPRITMRDVRNSINKLKATVGSDGVHSNHFKYCSNYCILFLSMMFTASLIHSYTPIDILKGIINPTIKNRYGNISDSSNYRPVMLSSIFLKLFEYCILDKIQQHITINDRQHGYKTKILFLVHA